MTIATCWIRKLKETEELCVVTDSRLRFGRAWDHCQKIFPLPRGDSFICFAGDTMYAYPIIMHIKTALSMNPKLMSRAADITQVLSTVIDLINDLRGEIYDLPKGLSANAIAKEKGSYRFIFGGWSWKEQQFRIWHIQYQQNIDRFSYRNIGLSPKPSRGGHRFVFIGDDWNVATRMLLTRMKNIDTPLNFEPASVIHEFATKKLNAAIGGPIQIVKAYQHMNCMQYNVMWESKGKSHVTLYGRKLLPYEKNGYLTIDPSTMEIFPPEQIFSNKP